jgi:uncharacterized repeat protein (TIGR04138 family)
MDDTKFQPLIRTIRRKYQRRYAEAAYFFVLSALDYSIFRLGKSMNKGDDQHITGQHLLDGIQQYAQEEFGPMAPFTFRTWGVQQAQDFGEIVFQMCHEGLLNAQDSDSLRDFEHGFDFEVAFSLS